MSQNSIILTYSLKIQICRSHVGIIVILRNLKIWQIFLSRRGWRMRFGNTEIPAFYCRFRFKRNNMFMYFSLKIMKKTIQFFYSKPVYSQKFMTQNFQESAKSLKLMSQIFWESFSSQKLMSQNAIFLGHWFAKKKVAIVYARKNLCPRTSFIVK